MEEHTATATTTTTTTTERRTVVTVGFNVGFLRTPIGILMLVELIFGLLAWTLLVSVYGFGLLGALGFAAFGFIFCWLATICLFVAFVFGLYGSVCANLPWGMIQVIANAVFALLCFVSSCCVAPYGYVGNLGASCAFGFILTVLYIISFLMCFRKAYGRFPWEKTTGAPTRT